MTCISTIAVACVLLVIVIAVVRPEWHTLLFGVPLAGFLLGGLGGLATLGCSPSWPRRLGAEPWRVVICTLYRLGSACLLGGLAFAASAAAMGGKAQDGWGFLAASLGAGLLEKPINDGMLKALGVVAPRESGSRST